MAARVERRIVVCMMAMFSLSSTAVVAQSPNFAGQNIEVAVGAAAGGGFDAYARLVSRHLGSYLPGNPKIVVEDMPGAGSLTAANWLTNSARKDGTAIAILPNTVLFEPFFGNHNAHFDPSKVNWLESLNDYIPVAAVWSQSPIKTVKDALSNEVLTGGQGSASGHNCMARNL